MGHHHDYVALDWVKGEISDTLAQARRSLEACIDSAQSGDQDDTRLRFCLNCIHQVHGALTMTGCYGAALLSAEVEALILAFLEGSGANRNEVLEVLMQSILQISSCLDLICRGRRDLPVAVLPVLNDLRAARGKKLLSETSLFTPHQGLPVSAMTGNLSKTFKNPGLSVFLKRLRQMYQMALIGYIKGLRIGENLGCLLNVSERLKALLEGTSAGLLWPVVSALLEGLATGGCKNSSTIRNLLRQVDTEIRKLIEDGEFAINRAVPEDLLNNLLYYVACSTTNGPLTKAIQAQYQLNDALPDANRVAREYQRLHGSDNAAMSLVIKAVSDKLISVKDELERYVRNPRNNRKLVKAQLPVLNQVVDTMDVLGLGIPRKVIQNQIDILSLMVNRGRYDGGVLTDVTGSLLYVEATLAGMAQEKPAAVSTSGVQEEVDLTGTHRKLVQKAINGLKQTKDAIVDYISSQLDTCCLAVVPDVLAGVCSDLSMIPLERVVQRIEATSQYVEQELLGGRAEPACQSLDILADAIDWMEYYLECFLGNQRGRRDAILGIVDECLNRLGYRPGRAAGEAPSDGSAEKTVSAFGEPMAVSSEPVDSTAPEQTGRLADDERLESFMTEAREVCETLAECFPRWQADSTDAVALAEIRRCFQVLKTSARLVDAAVVGELASRIDNMLNKIVDGAIDSVDAPIALVDRVIALLPSIIAALAEKRPGLSPDVQSLMDEADGYASGGSGKPVEVSAVVSRPETGNVDRRAAGPAESEVNVLDIFRKEALVHLQVINDFIAESNERQIAMHVSYALQRSLHALEGSASMAGIPPVAEVAASLEEMVKVFRAHNILADERVMALLNRGSLLIQDGLDQLDVNPLSPLVGANELLQEIQLLQSGRLADIDEKERTSVARQEPESVDLFLARGVDLLLEANNTLERWDHQQDVETAQALRKALMAVSDSAKRMDIEPLAILADRLIELYHRILQRQVAVDNDLIQLLRDSHEHLIIMMNQLAAQQTPTGFQPLLDRISMLLQDQVQTASDDEARDGSTAVEVAGNSKPASDNIGQELIALFLDEAVSILEKATDDLYRWLEYPDGQQGCLQALQRRFHTLKNSARMAGVTAIGDLGHKLECLYKDLCETRLSASQELINLLLRAHDALDEMLNQLRSNNVCRSAEDLCTLIREFRGGKDDDDQPMEEVPDDRQSSVSGSVSVALPDELDPEMVGIFLKEAADLLKPVEEQIAVWQSDTANMEPARELLQVLHTLKESAWKTGLIELGDASHQMTAVIEGLQQKGSVTGEEICALATDAEQLRRRVEGVASSLEQFAEPSVTAPVAEVPDASEAETDRKVAEVFSFLQSDDNGVPTIKSSALPASEQLAGNSEVEVPARDMVQIPAGQLEQLVNLAGDISVSRARIEQQSSDFSGTLQEMHDTIESMQEQLRRLDVATRNRLHYEGEPADRSGHDLLERDQYSELTRLSQSLLEATTNLMDLKESLANRNRNSETLITQQARINTELQEGLMRTRMMSFSCLLSRLRRIVRQVSSETGKDVELKAENAEDEMDWSIMVRMLVPLEHMLRNIINYSIESADERTRKGKPATARIHLVSRREGGDIVLGLHDDGEGLNPAVIREEALARGLLASGSETSDADVVRLILEPGFSPAGKVTRISGYGVGLDVVNRELRQLGGRLDLHYDQDDGTVFEVRVPCALPVSRALLVNQGEDVYAVPLDTIEGVARVGPKVLQASYDSGRYEHAGRGYRLHYLGEVLGKGPPSLMQITQDVPVLLVHSGDTRVALQVDGLSETREIVVKSLGPQFANVPGVSGATMLTDGRIVIILDVVALALKALTRAAATEHRAESAAVTEDHGEKGLVMVVESAAEDCQAITRLLGRHGYNTLAAQDGEGAMTLLKNRRPDLILLGIEMSGMDGFEVAAAVRNDPVLSSIPIIMITSRTGTGHRQRAMESGANDCMGKPLQEGPLLEAIEGLVSVYS